MKIHSILHHYIWVILLIIAIVPFVNNKRINICRNYQLGTPNGGLGAPCEVEPCPDDNDDEAGDPVEVDGGICGVGWSFIPETESCVLLDETPGSFAAGRASCRARGEGSDLASVLTIDEFNFIKNNFNPAGVSFIWIGLKDALESGSADISTRQFEWIRGEDFVFSQWKSGEPANEGGNAFCVAHEIGAMHEWNDKDCSQSYPAVCKKYVGEAPNEPGPDDPNGNDCGQGWDRLGDTDVCFYHQFHRRGFQMSSTACQARGGELASVLNQEEFDYIMNNYDNTNSAMLWIGLYDVSESNKKGPSNLDLRNFRWLDGAESNFSAWKLTEPSNGNEIQWCVAEDKSSSYEWNDRPCNRNYESVCKKTIANLCGQGWHQVGDACFKVLNEPRAETYNQALASCRAEGELSDLASILSDEEFYWVQENVNPVSAQFVWIGYQDQSNTAARDFEWSDGSEKGYEAWNTDAGEPDNAGGSERCTALDLSADHAWADKSCSGQYLPLCKKYLRNGPGSEPTDANPCGRGWDKVGNRCFFLQTSERDWDSSLEACASRGDGSFIASILTQEEQDFCRDNYTPRNRFLWIGLYDENNSRKRGRVHMATRDFQWADGAEVDFTAWKSNEPNNIMGNMWCTAMDQPSNHLWNDQPARRKAPSICAKTIINECGMGWDQVGDACFKILEGSGNWMHCLGACRSEGEGSDLASVLNDVEQQFIRDNYDAPSGNFLWIGLKDTAASSLVGQANAGSRVFEWTDGATYSYQQWDTSEPSNDGGTTHCAALDTQNNHMWNDQSCDASYTPVCKKFIRNAPVRTADPSNPCGFGWDQVGECCFLYQTSPRTFEKANDACLERGDGSAFASILNDEEFNFVRDNYATPNRFIYFGLQEMTGTKKRGYANRIYRDFQWTDGNALDYTNWKNLEPNNWGGFQYCGAFDKSVGYKWNDQKCWRTIRSVCKKCLISPCGDGWDMVGDACFKLMDGTGSYDNAMAACQAEGDFANLASETSQEEFDWVKNNYVATTSHLWIGLKDSAESTQIGKVNEGSRTWEWEDFSSFGFTAWDTVEPGNDGGNQWCGAHKIASDYKWDDQSCDQDFQFVCKKYHQNRPTPPDDPGQPCGYGWDQFGTACFLMQTRKANWQNSRDACIEKGGDLASIHSSDEMDFIRQTYRFPSDKIWIGLYDENESRIQGASYQASANFQWKDQSPVDYGEWQSREPNNFYKNQFCVAMMRAANLLWNDQTCNQVKSSLCRKDLAPLGPATPAPPAAASCESGWDQVGTTCFKYIAEQKTYGQAKTACTNQGGAHLATVSSAEELTHIASYSPGLSCGTGFSEFEENCYKLLTTGDSMSRMNGRALTNKGKLIAIHSAEQNAFAATLLTAGNPWIGLQQTGGVYTWRDDTALDYTNWDAGQPDTSKNCVLMNNPSGKWFTSGCTAQRKGLMQKYPDGNLWLGMDLTPRDPSGTWIWDDASAGNPDASLWDADEPNYLDEELCAVLWSTTSKARTVRCAHLNEFVCEKPAV